MYFQLHHERAFGTFPLKGDELQQALEIALDVGYRAIDTAQMYKNEKTIGDVVLSSSLCRDDLFITSKVPVDRFEESLFIPSIEQSLDDLQLDYLDVLLLHWPPANGKIEWPIEALCKAQQMGLCKHVGVSNFTSSMLKQISSITDIPIITNQVEFHPLLDQSTLLAAANDTGIPLSSYCSVARGAVFKEPLFQELAEAYSVSPGQIVLRWILQQGVSVNTMSTNRDNIRANFHINDFTLSHTDMHKIQQLTARNYRIVDKHLVPWAPQWDS